MPSRCWSIFIVVFWLCTTGCLLYRHVWPMLLPAQEPPYTINLEDEVQTQQAHIRWTVFYNDHPYLRAETWIKPDPADDTFALIAELRPLPRTKDAGAELAAAGAAKERDDGTAPFSGLVEIRRAHSEYRVTRQGDLRSVSLELSAVLGGVAPGEGSLQGEVRDGQFRPHVKASSPVLPSLDFDRDLDPVPVSAHGSVLSPMHPVNRIAGLRPGQTWRLPLVDPVRTVISAILKQYLSGFAPETNDQEIVVTARVLPEKQALAWNDAAVDCFVIEYQDHTADVTARTWVQAATGLVLRQEAEQGGERWVLQRE